MISILSTRERHNLLNGALTAETDFLPGGTIGGYVTTQHKETKIQTTYGLTNGHVVLAPCKFELLHVYCD